MQPVIPNLNHSIILNVRIKNQIGLLAKVTTAIGNAGGSIGAIDTTTHPSGVLVRQITVYTSGVVHAERVREAVGSIEGVDVLTVTDRTFHMHLNGKIETKSTVSVLSRENLSMAYTPGVARVCEAIYEDKAKAHKYTIKSNTVAIVSDGTAILGLGDLGPEAAMPVMEGKAMLFKDFAGVNAFPICLDTQDVEEIIQTVKYIAPGFGGINLEDISAPRCFEIERRLKKELNIPVFHDDQHGTAVVLAAGLLNALKLVGKKMEELKVVIVGIGAAGTACTKILQSLGVSNIIGCDRRGAISKSRSDLNQEKRAYAEKTNPKNIQGSLQDCMQGADVFIGLSAGKMITVDDIKKMNKDPLVFAMANPEPEIMPELAWPHVAVMATGRSDYPNQINNVLCFPGIFKGALECRASDINEEMKIAAAHAIASIIDDQHLSPEYIIPSVFNTDVVTRVSEAVIEAARASGVAGLKS
jgi:malate dehydrogenase (oxaloacetate-decarboxylating)